MPTRTREHGFALAVSIFALVIIAALITGIFFAAQQEWKIGLGSIASQRAFSAADAGINNAIANWNMNWNSLATGASASFNGTLPSGTGTYTGTVQHLNPQLYFVQVTGTDKNNLATRTLGALSRLLYVNVTIKGAVTTQNGLKIGGSSFINGVDTNPTGWSCNAVNDTLPGIDTGDSANITTAGCSNYSCVQGSPKVKQDNSITDSTFLKFGDFTWNDLVSMATKIYSSGYGPASDFGPVGTATTCTTSVQDNWGDPMVPPSVAGCAAYFPIIYVNGNLKLTGGYGQGILMVNGDLSVQGGFQFFGPVLVRGSLTTQGTGGHFNGGVMAANLIDSSSVVNGNAVVTYSSCALFKALQANSPGRWLRQRSWLDLF
jgi:Tfp pilus assembly protein PilX